MRRLTLPFLLFSGLIPLSLAGCGESYSPNTYASTAAQQQAAVERGVIIGVRPVLISPNGTVGAATGGAAGGVAGAQLPGSTVATAFGAIGGTLVGGISGAAAEQAVGKAKAWEYIVQETGNKLVSITQTSKTALPIGLNVLVIAGTQQARIVPDYTEQIPAPPTAKIAPTPSGAATTEIQVGPLPPVAGAAEPLQITPLSVASDPPTPPAPSPASAAPIATPPAPSSTPGEAATAEAASNKSSTTGAPPVVPAATSAQATPGASNSTPPVNSTPTTTP